MRYVPFSMTPDKRIPEKRIETTPINPEWKYWIQNKWWSDKAINDSTAVKQIEFFRRIHELLLTIGGEETCFPDIEEDAEAILNRGYFISGKEQTRIIKGVDSQCHKNSANLWLNNRDKDIHIMTGYALSDDGMWRQHSWLLQRYETRTQRRMRIIETTVKRVAYFGFEMTDEEAQDFATNNQFW